MRFLTRIVLFFFLFSVIFYIIRSYDIMPIAVLSRELNGIGWLYSVIGLIFGVISGFIIQTQWDAWDNLTNAMHGELKSLRQLYQYSRHISPKARAAIKKTIKEYVHAVIIDWHKNLNGEETNLVNSAMQELQESVIALEENTRKFEVANTFFLSFLGYHEDVIHYSSRRLPKILHILIIFASMLVIGLSLFIGVKTFWLDYITTLSIALLAFLIYYVIHDLDNPLRPGNWHITNTAYKTLLEELQVTE